MLEEQPKQSKIHNNTVDNFPLIQHYNGTNNGIVNRQYYRRPALANTYDGFLPRQNQHVPPKINKVFAENSEQTKTPNYNNLETSNINEDRRVKINPFGQVKVLSPQHLKVWLLYAKTKKIPLTAAVIGIISTLILGVLLPWWESGWQAGAYALSPADSAVIAKPNAEMASDIKSSTPNQEYSFNSQFNPLTESTANDVSFGGAKIQATFPYESTKGIVVTDPYSKASITITPKFNTMNAELSQNQIKYPIFTGRGSIIYTAEAGGVKEDLLLRQYDGNQLNFSYKLGLGNTYIARVLSDGSLAIYGSSLPINGDVSTGSAKDAELLAKAREKAPKNKLLFMLPSPEIKERDGHHSSAVAHYSLNGDTLTVSVNGLNTAAYPLSIDPSVTVASVSTFFRDTNDETNADFNAAYNQINRGSLTGGDIQSWAQTNNYMTQARGMAGSATYNGYAYVLGGADAGTINNYTGPSYIEYGAISPNSSGSIYWSNANSTGLPATGLSRYKLVAYNGYLYAIDGSLTDTSCGTLSGNIYYSAIQVNGVLNNWQSIAGPTTAVCSYGATAYDGYLYVAGGKTGSANNTAITTVNYAPILPNGTLGAWATTTALPTATYGGDLQAYNGYLYFLGGNQNGTLTNTVEYIPIQSTGALYTTWTTTNSFITARENLGANFTAVNNGYIYISGGCTAVYTNQGCSTISGDTQLAQINADGSIGQWFANSTPPLVGSDVIQPISGSVVAGTAEAFPSTANNSGSINSISLYVNSGNSATAVNIGIYTNNGGVPNTLLGSGSISSPQMSAWNNISLSSSVSITSGTTYWIAILGTGGTLNFREGSTQSSSTETGLSSLPSSWSQTTSNGGNGPLSAYASYDVSSLAGADISSWNGAIYDLAGCTVMSSTSTAPQCSTALASQYYALYSPPGNVSALKTSSNTIPSTEFGGSAAVMDGYIYVVGGCIVNSCSGTGATSNFTMWAPINSDGTIGAWTKDTTNTINGSTGITETALVAENGILYALGGYNGSSIVKTIWTESPNPSSGALTAAWASNSKSLTSAVFGEGAIYFNSNIYTFGGCSASSGLACTGYTGAVTQYSVSGTTIGTGSTTSLTAIPTGTINDPNAFMGLAYYDGYVYLCGGSNSNSTADGGPQTSKCIYNQLSSSGTMTGSWLQTTGSLNQDITMGSVAVMNGYLYVFGGYDGNDNSSGTGLISNDINIGKINLSSGDIATFTLSGTNITSRWGLTDVSSNGNVYTFGGCSIGNSPSACTNITPATEYFKVFNAGNEATRAITSGNVLPTSTTGGAVAVSNGYIYFAGGCSNTTSPADTICHNGSFTSSNVYYAPLNPDGSVGTWQTSSNNLPNTLAWGCMEAVNGSLYYIGGRNTRTAESGVSKSIIGANGAPGTWDSGVQASFPNNIMAAGCTTYNGIIYVVGGYTGTAAENTVYYSTIDGNGNITAWTAGATFNTARYFLSADAVAGYLYVLGGYTGSAALADVQTIKLVPGGGTVGSWGYSRDLPYTVYGAANFAANGYVYMLGGANGTATTSCLNSTIEASITSNGAVGDWTQGTAATFTALVGMSGGYFNGYYYAIGGYNCSSGGYSNSDYIAGEQSQAIRAIFSRYINLGSDGTPEKILLQGTNAAVSGTDIEKWSLSYRSSRAATNAWGASTLFNPIPFNSVQGVSALDSSSANQGVAEYWFLLFEIDQTQTFGFTDGSQPTINRYDFYYAPGASTRLRNGKTFQDQVQQSLDAHP